MLGPQLEGVEGTWRGVILALPRLPLPNLRERLRIILLVYLSVPENQRVPMVINFSTPSTVFGDSERLWLQRPDLVASSRGYGSYSPQLASTSNNFPGLYSGVKIQTFTLEIITPVTCKECVAFSEC